MFVGKGLGTRKRGTGSYSKSTAMTTLEEDTSREVLQIKKEAATPANATQTPAPMIKVVDEEEGSGLMVD